MINMQQLYMEAKGVWKTIYPIYFDSTKSISQGRRVSKQIAISNPTAQQVANAIGMLQIRNILQDHKSYPRDYFYRGRLKVQLLNDKKQPMRKDIPNSTPGLIIFYLEKVLYKEICKNLKKIRLMTQKK